MKRIFKHFINVEKEEAWLNEMAANGFLLVKKSFFYHFHEITNTDHVIRIDYRNFHRKKDFIDYVTLFEDSGWTHVGGSMHSGAQYFSRKSADASEDIFSDMDSKTGRYECMAKTWSSVLAGFIPIVVVFTISDTMNFANIFTPEQWYYTPGLWEKEGWSFWKAFLFETPFALLRGVFPALSAIAMGIAIIGFTYAKWKYEHKETIHQ